MADKKKKPNKIYFIFSDESAAEVWAAYEREQKAAGKQRMYLRQECFLAGMRQKLKGFK